MSEVSAQLATWFADPLVAAAALVLAGTFAGIINSMAGGGSFLTIPVLMMIGIPLPTVNGTIRVGVLTQNLVGVTTFHRRGIREYGAAFRLLPAVAVGALAGALLATRMEDALLRPVFGAAFLAWAILLAFRPNRFVNPPEKPRPIGAAAHALALGVGLYGGFLQAGVGFPLLALLVMYLGYDPVRANAIKFLLVGLYTVVALPVFVVAGEVAWVEAGALAVGTMLGAWIGARWQIEKGAGLVRWFVLIAVAVAGAAMLASAF